MRQEFARRPDASKDLLLKYGSVVALLSAIALGVGVGDLASEDLQVGIIDFYGLGGVSEAQARQALTVGEGDRFVLVGDEAPAFLVESERRLSMLAGVSRAHVELVCCEAGRWIVYAGVEGPWAHRSPLRAAPKGSVRLPADVVQAGAEFDAAQMAALERGEAGEDRSRGHALSHDPASRAIEERFAGYAARHLDRLRRVLHDASDGEQRALAAQVVAYTSHKQAVVGDLVFGMSDPYAGVRNNCMRALALFAGMAPSRERPVVRIPAEPFVGLLQSVVWTDRNKASFALDALTEPRDPGLLDTLRREALGPLVEMARWKSMGHAGSALTILGRVGGLSEADIAASLSRGQRDSIIGSAQPARQ